MEENKIFTIVSTQSAEFYTAFPRTIQINENASWQSGDATFFGKRIAAWSISQNSSLDKNIFPFKAELHAAVCRVSVPLPELKFLNPFWKYLHEEVLDHHQEKFFMGQGSASTLALQNSEADQEIWSQDGCKETQNCSTSVFPSLFAPSQQLPWITSRKNRGRFWREMRAAVGGRGAGPAYARVGIKGVAEYPSKIGEWGKRRAHTYRWRTGLRGLCFFVPLLCLLQGEVH